MDTCKGMDFFKFIKSAKLAASKPQNGFSLSSHTCIYLFLWCVTVSSCPWSGWASGSVHLVLESLTQIAILAVEETHRGQSDE